MLIVCKTLMTELCIKIAVIEKNEIEFQALSSLVINKPTK
jgi:hypothetical protein